MTKNSRGHLGSKFTKKRRCGWLFISTSCVLFAGDDMFFKVDVGGKEGKK